MLTIKNYTNGVTSATKFPSQPLRRVLILYETIDTRKKAPLGGAFTHCFRKIGSHLSIFSTSAKN